MSYLHETSVRDGYNSQLEVNYTKQYFNLHLVFIDVSIRHTLDHILVERIFHSGLCLS